MGKRKTEIHVRGYSCDFIMTVRGMLLTLDQATEHVQKEIINTAVVQKLIQFNGKEQTQIINTEYERFEPFRNGSAASKYLNRNNGKSKEK